MIYPTKRKRTKMGVREPSVIRSPSHLAWIRTHVCVLSNRGECDGRIEAAHVRIGHGGGMGMKPGDDRSLPLCHSHHAEQHNIGDQTFQAKYSINLLEIAEIFAKRSPHRKGWS